MERQEQGCAVITGGAGGIGVAAARLLAARGMRVALWDKSPAAAALAQALPGGFAVAVDVTDPDSVRTAAAETAARAGGIHVLVNAAGITGPNATVAEYAVEDWRRVMAINLDGTFLCCKFIVPFMVRAGYGRIVNVSSIAGKEGNPNAAAYSASKAGVIALTKSLGKELVDADIRVNCITPAMIETELLHQMRPEFIEYVKGKIPLGRLGRVEEVAALIGWLASPECSFSTGAVFDISGGRATY